MSMFKAQFIFAMGRGVVKEVKITPSSGIKQGDPLFPAVFVMVCSIVVHALKEVSPQVNVLFYADDLLQYTPPPPRMRATPPHLRATPTFRHFHGTQNNLSKSALLTKGAWPDQYIQILRSFGVEVKQKVNCRCEILKSAPQCT